MIQNIYMFQNENVFKKFTQTGPISISFIFSYPSFI